MNPIPNKVDNDASLKSPESTTRTAFKALRVGTLRVLFPALLASMSMSTSLSAQEYEAGWRQVSLPVPAAQAPLSVALYYPSAAVARTISMGPFDVNVAIQAQAAGKFKALIVLSHGLGGSELGHSSLAEALARAGYLVAALRHPGDNWQDRSLIENTPGQYFLLRPRALSQVIDAILAKPEWADRIARDDKGPMIGALGHSAGGFSVIALAGGQPDTRRVVAHCAANAAQDPIFCGVGRETPSMSGSASNGKPGDGAASTALTPGVSTADLSDRRVRAVIAMAPVGVPFTISSLNAIKIPTLIYEAEKDRFLVSRFHAGRIAKDTPAAELRTIPNAWHFAFMDQPSMSIPSPDGDLRANPTGFDRGAFLRQMGRDIPAWFDKTLR